MTVPNAGSVIMGNDVTPFETLTSLLASPPAGRATALDAPGAMLYEVGWKWAGDLGLVSSYAVLTALPTTNMGLVCACLANPLTPLGWTRMRLSSGIWIPEYGQILAGESALYLLDMTASALTPGVLTEVYQSDVLPNWMFPNGGKFAISAEISISDASVASAMVATAGVSSVAWANSNAQLSLSTSSNSFGKGFGAIPSVVRRQGTGMRGSPGASLGSGAPALATIGSYADGAMRFRLSVNPSAATNAIKLVGWTLVYA